MQGSLVATPLLTLTYILMVAALMMLSLPYQDCSKHMVNSRLEVLLASTTCVVWRQLTVHVWRM